MREKTEEAGKGFPFPAPRRTRREVFPRSGCTVEVCRTGVPLGIFCTVAKGTLRDMV